MGDTVKEQKSRELGSLCGSGRKMGVSEQKTEVQGASDQQMISGCLCLKANSLNDHLGAVDTYLLHRHLGILEGPDPAQSMCIPCTLAAHHW